MTAFSSAMALESIPDDLKKLDIDPKLLIEYAATVAYKTFHNLKHGHVMDKLQDPVMVGDEEGQYRPAHEVWSHHYD